MRTQNEQVPEIDLPVDKQWKYQWISSGPTSE